MAKRNTNLMTEGRIMPIILLFSIPLILGNLLQQMYNTADSIIVGNYVGAGALAAVGASTALINLLIAFSQGAAVGAGVICAQYIGAKDGNNTEKAVHTALAISLILGIVLSIVGFIFSRQILNLMGTPEDILSDAALYLKIYCAGLVFNVLYNMCTGILNSAGNSRRPLYYLAAASITNIVLDIILIAFFGMGVEGAAIATIISQAISCILAMRHLLTVDDSYRVKIRKIVITPSMARRIITIGLPAGVQNMVISFSNVLVQSAVNSFGSAAVAGFASYMKIDGFNILPITSFSLAVTTFTGQNCGAGKIDRVKKGAWITILMGVVYCFLTGVLLLVFSHPIMRMFTSDETVIEYGRLAMRYFCPFYALLAILNILAGTIRGAGKSMPPMIILLTAMCLFRIVWLQFATPLFSDISGVYIIYPVSWILGVVLMLLYTWKGKWLPKAS